MTSPDIGAAGSPIAALLRRALIALGVAAAFVVAGLLLSGDRAQAAEPEDAPGLVGELLAPVTSALEDTVLDEAVDIVDAVVAPVDDLTTPIVEPVLDPVLDTVRAAIPTEAIEPVVAILPEIEPETTAPAPAAAAPRPAESAPSTVEVSTTASIEEPEDSPRTPVAPHPADAVTATLSAGASAILAPAPTASAAAPRLDDADAPPLPAPPAAPTSPSDSTPD